MYQNKKFVEEAKSMSWRNREIRVLSKREIEERYPKDSDSNRAKLTRDFMKEGFKIVYLKMDGLGIETPSMRHADVVHSMGIVMKNDNFQIGCYTDMSELEKDILYVAVKVLGRPRNCYH